MKIYTKTGDKGTTSLIGGSRVFKDDIRIEAYGTCDELNSFVGLLRSCDLSSEIDVVLHAIQNDLFAVGTCLAIDYTKGNSVEKFQITEENILNLERNIDFFSENLPALKNFILPAGNKSVALSHICRTITRRLERRIVAIKEENAQPDNSLRYINRLSDFFFVLARKLTTGVESEILL